MLPRSVCANRTQVIISVAAIRASARNSLAMFIFILPERTRFLITKDPASETKRNGRLWQAYSFTEDLQYTASRLLFISYSSRNTLKKNELTVYDNYSGSLCRA